MYISEECYGDMHKHICYCGGNILHVCNVTIAFSVSHFMHSFPQGSGSQSPSHHLPILHPQLLYFHLPRAHQA